MLRLAVSCKVLDKLLFEAAGNVSVELSVGMSDGVSDGVFANGSCVAVMAAGVSGLHISEPFHCWPHQHLPWASMRQVPVPQQRSSVCMQSPVLLGQWV